MSGETVDYLPSPPADPAPLRDPVPPADPEPDPGTPGGPGYRTSEFGAMLTAVVTNTIIVLSMMGYMSHTDADNLTKLLLTALGSVMACLPNVIAVWKFISSRVHLKTTKVEAVYRRLADANMLAISHVRAKAAVSSAALSIGLNPEQRTALDKKMKSTLEGS